MPKGKPGDDKKRKPVPMPKPKPGRPAPKGGKVIEKKLEDRNQMKGGGPLSLAELRKRIPSDTISNSKAKRKPVMPPRRGR
jgi:hypothetical protein